MNTVLMPNRHIRVFISSTFRDMQDERNELITKTFPILKKKAAERDVILTELDLRWGITEDEAKNGKVVEVCLNEIENCIPFFVGIIGNRYGWIPDKTDLYKGVVDRYAVVDTYLERHLSVTEMEMQFGVLERADENLHAYFFLKDQQDDACDEPQKLAALREKVRDSKYPSSTYTSKEDLGIQVEKAFTELLDQLFPEETVSQHEKDCIAQQSFINQLCLSYVREESNFLFVDDWVINGKEKQLVITGKSGSGKSAFLANWAKEKISQSSFKYHIIYYSVGSGSGRSEVQDVIDYISKEIYHIYHWEDKKIDFDELLEKVSLEGDKPLLVVIDAINQIENSQDNNEHSFDAKNLNWLSLPPHNIKMILPTIEDDTTMGTLRNREHKELLLKPLTIDQRRDFVKNFLALYSKKLTDQQLERIVTDSQCENTLVLKTLLNELIKFGVFEELDNRINFYLKDNTIEDFFQSLLINCEEEFSDYGKDFTQRILTLIGLSRNGLSEDEIISILGLKQLHWSQFYCSFSNHLINKNGLISFSHEYIRKAVETRYLDDYSDFSEDVIRELRRTLLEYFEKQNNQHSMIELPYQYCMDRDGKKLNEILLDFNVFQYYFNNDWRTLFQFWNILLGGRGFINNKIRGLRLHGGKSPYSPLDYLKHLQPNEPAYAEKLFLLYDFFSSIGLCRNESKQILQCIEKTSLTTEEQLKYGEEMYKQLLMEDNLDEALKVAIKTLNLAKKIYGKGDSKILDYLDLVSDAYNYLGDEIYTIKYAKKSLSLAKKINGAMSVNYAISLENLAITFACYDDYKTAIKYCEQALSIYKNIKLEWRKINALCNLGSFYISSDESPKGISLLEEGLEIAKSIYGESDPHIASILQRFAQEYLNIRSLSIQYRNRKNDRNIPCYAMARQMGIQALDILRKAYGKDNLKTAELLCFVTEILLSPRDEDDLEQCCEFAGEAIDIYERILGENDYKTAEAYFLYGRVLHFQGLSRDIVSSTCFEGALQYFIKAYYIYHSKQESALHQRAKDIYNEHIEEAVIEIKECLSHIKFYNLESIGTTILDEAKKVIQLAKKM